MSGMLSSLFDAGEPQATSSEQTLAADTGADLALSPTVSIETSGSYEDANGATTEWSNTTEIGADINLSLIVHAATAITDVGASEA